MKEKGLISSAPPLYRKTKGHVVSYFCDSIFVKIIYNVAPVVMRTTRAVSKVQFH